jgi:hypothetical protein
MSSIRNTSIRNTSIKKYFTGLSVRNSSPICFQNPYLFSELRNPRSFTTRLKTAGNKTIRNRFYAIRAIN